MIFRISLIFSVFIVCILFASSTFAQKFSRFGKCPIEYGFQGSYNFVENSKSSISVRKLKELSPVILSRIQEQLKNRVGEQFFKKLKLDYGYAKDFDDASPLRADDTGRIEGYDFTFKFSDKSKGLKSFYFKVVADATGKLIENLALPDIASDSSKAVLISCKEALAIAAKNGFPFERSSIYFIYDWDSKTFIWKINDNKAVEPDESPLLFTGKGTYRTIHIDANNGKIIRIFKETIIV